MGEVITGAAIFGIGLFFGYVISMASVRSGKIIERMEQNERSDSGDYQ